MSADTLLELFRRVSAAEYTNETSFVIDAIPQLIRALGYAEHNLLFEHRIAFGQRQYFADAIVTASPAIPPRLLIEAKNRRFFERRPSRDGEEQLRSYHHASSAELSVLFAPQLIWVLDNGNIEHFDLHAITAEQAERIYEQLRCPPDWPPPIPDVPAPMPSGSSQITFHYFAVSRDALMAALNAVETATTNDEKGRSLESLASLLFGGLTGVSVKYRNLLGASNEIDLVLEYNRTVFNPAFDEFGRFALVECKNWATAVGAKHVRDFMVKLNKTKVRLGFLLARNGVTGAHDGADALREIHSAMDRDGILIIVLTLDDISSILSGADYYQIIDDKIDRLRFDL